ncbi:MAG: nitroreductase [Cohaesibacter sp.]|nr:nitroreductase [Cohaesibacter sp.]
MPQSVSDPKTSSIEPKASSLAPASEKEKQEAADRLFSLITSRHSVSPKVLQEPGPNEEQLQKLIEVASCVPDHGLRRPWRFILFPKDKRPALADLFEQALLERLPNASNQERQRARDKAARAPLLLGIVAQLSQDNETVAHEDQIASAGAALQNILLQAHAFGFGARATSGRAVRTKTFRSALNLTKDELFLCFVSIGTASKPAKHKDRPEPARLLTIWP